MTLVRSDHISGLLTSIRPDVVCELIRVKATRAELAAYGNARVAAVVDAFNRLDEGGGAALSKGDAASISIWARELVSVGVLGARAPARAAMALALVHPLASDIVPALELHAARDFDHCLLVANYTATGEGGLTSIRRFHGASPPPGIIDSAIAVALHLRQVDLVLDMAKGGWDVVGGIWRTSISDAVGLLGHPDFPPRFLNNYMTSAIQDANRERIVAAASCGALLPADAQIYERLLEVSEDERGDPDWCQEIGAAISSCPNWREVWPGGAAEPLEQFLAAERARSSPGRLKPRIRLRP